jgi:hypothetical protein
MKHLAFFFLLLGGCAADKYADPRLRCDSASEPVYSGMEQRQPADLQDLVRRRQELERQSRCKAEGGRAD